MTPWLPGAIVVVLIAIASVALLSTPDAPVSLKRSTAPTATPTVKLQQKLDENLAKRKQSEEQVVEGKSSDPFALKPLQIEATNTFAN